MNVTILRFSEKLKHRLKLANVEMNKRRRDCRQPISNISKKRVEKNTGPVGSAVII